MRLSVEQFDGGREWLLDRQLAFIVHGVRKRADLFGDTAGRYWCAPRRG